MGVEGQTVVEQALRVREGLLRRQVEIVRYALHTDASGRQRAPESVTGAGISGTSDIVSIAFHHNSMIHGARDRGLSGGAWSYDRAEISTVSYVCQTWTRRRVAIIPLPRIRTK
ncbi:hypothetical protein GCM10027089_22790 [Nocardia thraciensis]